jgi:hypothetical protein
VDAAVNHRSRARHYNAVMKLALLGADEDSLKLIRWAVEEGGHELVAAYEAGRWEAEVRAIAPRVRTGESWEGLVLGSAAEAVIVGLDAIGTDEASGVDGAERRADQFRKLVQAAVPLIVICPACEAIVGFEIEMIRRDAGGVIVPLVTAADHPAIVKLVELVSWGPGSPIGSIEQITLDREQADRSREAVLFQFARDVTLLRQLIGTVQSVSATGPTAQIGRDPLGPKPKELPSLANLSVFFSGDLGLAARWSVSPGPRAMSARLTIVGQRGKAILNMPAEDDWSLEISGDQPSRETFAAELGSERVLWKLSHAASSAEFRDDDAWLAACRDQEAAEAVDRSLQRGRTIELYGEEHTETDSFKGVMAMGGCLLLLLVIGVTFTAALAEGLRLPLRAWPIVQMWPICLLVPVAIFLLMQLLQLAVKRPESGAGRVADTAGPRT